MANNLAHGASQWTDTITQSSQSSTYTFSTADKYIDKDIALTVKAQDGTGSISGGQININLQMEDNIYLTREADSDSENRIGPITITPTVTKSPISVNISKAGWFDNGDISETAETISTNTNKLYVKKGSASVDSGQSITTTGSITNNNGVLTATLSGSKTIIGSATEGWVSEVNGATVSSNGTATTNASELDSNLVAANIVKGKTIFGITGTEANAKAATFSNEASKNTDGTAITYTDISDASSALIADDYLYINEGYTGNQKISLAKLVPDGTTVTTSTESPLIYRTVTARNDDGDIITGTMADAELTSGKATLVEHGFDYTDTDGNTQVTNYDFSNDDGSKFMPGGSTNYFVTVNVDQPIINTKGYITDTIGTLNANNQQVLATRINWAQGDFVKTTMTAAAGYSSIDINGYYDGNEISSIDSIILSTTPTAGYYKLRVQGYGRVKGATPTFQINSSGWAAAGTYRLGGTAPTGTTNDGYYYKESNIGYTEYYVKKSTLTSQTITPLSTAQTLTIDAGYYPDDRTITISAVDASSSEQVAQGAISAADSSISTISATAGTATVDTTAWTYNIPLTLSASGTAYAKVSTIGYVTSSNNTSQALTKTGSATVSLNVYSGEYTIS